MNDREPTHVKLLSAKLELMFKSLTRNGLIRLLAFGATLDETDFSFATLGVTLRPRGGTSGVFVIRAVTFLFFDDIQKYFSQMVYNVV